MVHICNSLYWKYCGGNNHCYHFLNKKLFIYQRISWNFVSVVIYLFYTYVFFFSNAIIDVKFCFSSSVWNLIMKCILKNIFTLFNIEAWILMKSSELLWLSVIQMFIYIYVIIIVSYRFYCLLLNDLTVEIYLLHDILIIKDKISTYSYSLLLQVLFYSNVFFIDPSTFKCRAF